MANEFGLQQICDDARQAFKDGIVPGPGRFLVKPIMPNVGVVCCGLGAAYAHRVLKYNFDEISGQLNTYEAQEKMLEEYAVSRSAFDGFIDGFDAVHKHYGNHSDEYELGVKYGKELRQEVLPIN